MPMSSLASAMLPFVILVEMPSAVKLFFFFAPLCARTKHCCGLTIRIEMHAGSSSLVLHLAPSKHMNPTSFASPLPHPMLYRCTFPSLKSMHTPVLRSTNCALLM